MLKFWRWLRRFAENQCQHHVNCDLKCPQCKLWYSAVDGKHIAETNEGYLWECGHCECLTEWSVMMAPFPVLWTINTLRIEKSERSPLATSVEKDPIETAKDNAW